MRQYISKSAVVAEIEKLKSNLIYGACASQIAMETRCKEEAYNEVLSYFDTLEVKEVDLDKILIGFQNKYAYENSGELPSAIEIAKYFFELGLKAQKGE